MIFHDLLTQVTLNNELRDIEQNISILVTLSHIWLPFWPTTGGTKAVAEWKTHHFKNKNPSISSRKVTPWKFNEWINKMMVFNGFHCKKNTISGIYDKFHGGYKGFKPPQFWLVRKILKSSFSEREKRHLQGAIFSIFSVSPQKTTPRKSNIHSSKLTCPLKMDYFNRKYIFQPLIFRSKLLIFQGLYPLVN